MEDKLVIVDGVEIKASELGKLKEDAKKSGKLLKEIQPGVFKTLEKLKD